YQSFEHGFMLWRSDQETYGYGHCLKVVLLTEQTLAIMLLGGSLLPVGTLGKVWNYYDEIRINLGFANQPEQRYMATIPTNDEKSEMDGSPFYVKQITLPDDRILWCG